jgi:DMSO/TMAO reductase YedYZ molybdopterin-dependent catalytic subunit
MRSVTRREALRDLAVTTAALSAAAVAWPALAQDEVVIPFIDLPAAAPGAPPQRVPPSLQTFYTPNDEFFAVQHYAVPPVDAATHRLQIAGLIEHAFELSTDELRKRPRMEQVIGFECSGNNNARGNPLVGNARWAGTGLAGLLRAAGLKSTAKEIVFFSADRNSEEISHGGNVSTVDQHFARSLSVDDAMRPEVMLAYEMNGAPLPAGHGGPVRLIVPGWYGVANVKWLQRIHVQDTRFMGKFMAREYVTLRGTDVAGETIWNESSVARMRLKSFIGRVTRRGGTCTVTGVAMTDGTPLKAVEVRVDDGPWKPATLSKENTQYSWKMFTYTWQDARPGEHRLVSRAIDVNGAIQPEAADPNKKTRWENNEQFVRRLVIPS